MTAWRPWTEGAKIAQWPESRPISWWPDPAEEPVGHSFPPWESLEFIRQRGNQRVFSMYEVKLFRQRSRNACQRKPNGCRWRPKGAFFNSLVELFSGDRIQGGGFRARGSELGKPGKAQCPLAWRGLLLSPFEGFDAKRPNWAAEAILEVS